MSPINVNEDPLRQKLYLYVDPVSEMFNSLHVLAEPSHHLSNQAWAAATLAGMDTDLREEVMYFGQHFDQWLSIADVVHLVGALDLAVPDFLERAAALPSRQVVDTALGIPGIPEYGGPSVPENPATMIAHEEAQRDTDAFVRRVLAVLHRYWTEVFANEWERRYPLLQQRRTVEAARLDSMSPEAWLTSLHERISYDAKENALIFHKGKDLRFALDQVERILSIPSTFTAPHLMVGYMEGELVIFINVAMVLSMPERVPPGLLDVAKALADETRLRIFKAVLRKPHYTQELALAMGLAEPTVSRHLKVLKAARLVRSSKEGSVVLYSGLLEPVDRLPAVMREFLRG